jgi:hypothetical protein
VLSEVNIGVAMNNEIPEIPEINKKSRLERWPKYGALFGAAIAILDLTGWRGDVYSGSLINSIGYSVGSIMGGAILFGLAALFAIGLGFVINKISGLVNKDT